MSKAQIYIYKKKHFLVFKSGLATKLAPKFQFHQNHLKNVDSTNQFLHDTSPGVFRALGLDSSTCHKFFLCTTNVAKRLRQEDSVTINECTFCLTCCGSSSPPSSSQLSKYSPICVSECELCVQTEWHCFYFSCSEAVSEKGGRASGLTPSLSAAALRQHTAEFTSVWRSWSLIYWQLNN